MKNKLLGSAAALVVLTGSSAFAADLPVYVEPVAPAPMAAAAPLWTGFYVGAAAGFAFDDDDGFDCEIEGCFAEYGFDDDDDGDDDTNWFVGLRAGADWQFGNFVVGALIDANWLDSGDSSSSAFDADLIGEPDGAGVDPEDQEAFIDGQTIVLGDFPGQAANATYVVEDFSGIEWFGTARVRAGFAPGGGRFLIYGTGGLAFGGGNDGGGYSAFFSPGEVEVATGNGDSTMTSDDELDDLSDLTGLDCDRADFVRTDGGFDIDADEGAMCSSGDGDNDVMWGFALGAGAEVLVTDHISVGIEALYVNLDGDDFEFDEVFDGSDDDGADNDFWTVGLNVNARF